MSSSFALGKFDAGNANELDALNIYLESKAYVNGFVPSFEDHLAFTNISNIPDSKKYPNVARWYQNISSYDRLEQSGWPKQSPASETAENEKKERKNEEDFDLFGDDDSEDEEKKRITEERLKAYAEKKSKKPGPIAKSNVIYDVKPWDDTIIIGDIEKAVRSIEMDGLVWGSSKVVPVAFGLNKLQICCCIEDEKVSTDFLEEQIVGFEDLVQSVDIVAFNKV